VNEKGIYRYICFASCLQLLWVLHQSGMTDLFLYIACSENEQQYYMHILEVSVAFYTG
jgi:hypothetical protein